MDEPLYERFKALVLQGFTVTAIRTELGEALKSYSDPELIRQMVSILGGA